MLKSILEWPIWEQFRLVHAHSPALGSIFGLAEYLASLALFLVVMTTSDFRYSYRLALTKSDLRRIGFWIGFCIGSALLATDVWFENELPIPKLISNPNNVKALLGFAFLAFVFHVIFVAVIRPPIFTKANAKQFLEANFHYIHQGNPDRLQILAEELRRSAAAIVASAATISNPRDKNAREKMTQEQACANDFLLLIGDGRFCKIVVDKVPAFAFVYFQEVQKYPTSHLPIFQFARNVGQEFIRNTNSSFYQEESGYYSGLVGYTRPATKIVFGSYEFVERCASDGASPLDTDYRELYEFSAKRMQGYARASLAFLESYLEVTKGRWYPRSYALARMLHSFESSLVEVYQLNGEKDFLKARAYERLTVTVDFINKATTLVEKLAVAPKNMRISDPLHADMYDDLAHLIFETIFAASSVSSPTWTSWSIQHNVVWSGIFGLRRSKINKIIALKVRRLLYNEIKDMNRFANFKGARILGYCLNILGLKLMDRHQGYQKEFYPLQAAAVSWTKANYKRLLADHPKVAQTCLQGSVSYDSVNHRLIKTYANETEKEPAHDFLDLD